MGQHFEVFGMVVQSLPMALCTVASTIILLMERKSLSLGEDHWHEGEYLFITSMLEGVLSKT